MTEINCMTVKELIARWKGLRLTHDGHVNFIQEIPPDADRKELGRRRVPDRFIPPSLYVRWFQNDNPSTAALIRDLVNSGQLSLYRLGRRFLSNGRWLHEVESVSPAMLKKAGASMLLIGRQNINDVERDFHDHRQDDIQIRLAMMKEPIQEPRQDISSPADVTDRSHSRIKPNIQRMGMDKEEAVYRGLKNTKPENIVKKMREQFFPDDRIAKIIFLHKEDFGLCKRDIARLLYVGECTKNNLDKYIKKLLNK